MDIWKALAQKALEVGLFKKDDLIELLEQQKEAENLDTAKIVGGVEEKPENVEELATKHPELVQNVAKETIVPSTPTPGSEVSSDQEELF